MEERQDEGHGGHLLHSSIAHRPGSGIWRLPFLSTTSRGGRGCPVPASTPVNVGLLKDTGGGWVSQRSGCVVPAQHQCALHRHCCLSTSGSTDTQWAALTLSQRWPNSTFTNRS